ncbi:response regulator, partial [Vibrio cholerae]|nr:response regulator [Vibrio cholerae]
MKILIVEDDKTIASGLDYSLQSENYDTIICHDAKGARKTIAAELNHIDLCLFDLSLPDGSGYELCELVKSKSDKPVIFLTA